MKKIKLIILTVMLLAIVGLSDSKGQTILVNGSANYYLCPGISYELKVNMDPTGEFADSTDWHVIDAITPYYIHPNDPTNIH